MKKCIIFFYTFIYVCILVGCQRQVNSENYDTTPAPSTPHYTETPSHPIPDNTKETEQTTSPPPKDVPQPNADFMTKPNTKEQYKVSSSLEFYDAIGSHREILLYPGDYTQRIDIKDVSNLTITGIPANEMEYVDYQNTIQFTNCTRIKISNLSIKFNSDRASNIGFINSHDISINNCKIFISDDPYELFHGSGLRLENVNNFICSDTIIQNYYRNIDLFLTKNSKFINCTLIGSHLQIGDALNDGPCENIIFKDCALLSEAGICSTWSNYVPIANKSGYEIEMGTEEWQERRFIDAIVYDDQISSWSDIRYINTYNGSIDNYEDGRIINLAEHLRKMDTIKAFPSIDCVVAEDADWNQYYSYYSEPESVKLNINILEDDKNPDITKMMNKTKKLSELANVILDFDCSITIVYRDASNSSIIAYAEFSNQNFEEFLLSGDIKKWENYCYIVIPYWSPISKVGSFSLEAVNEGESTLDIYDLFLTNTVEIYNGMGQLFGRLFIIGKDGGYYRISAVESFAGAGDFMHYYTDLIIVEDLRTNDIYIASDQYYKIDKNSNVDKDIIINALRQLYAEENKQPVYGDICEDVILIIENNDISPETISFVFLTKIADADGMSEYVFYYYIATYDANADKISKIDFISLCSFKDIISDI